MTTYKLALSQNLKTVYIGKDTVTFPVNNVSLGTFDHNESDDPVHAYGANHALFHHIRDILYKRKAVNGTSGASYPAGIYNMQALTFSYYGAAIQAEWLAAAAIADLDLSDSGTATVAIKYHGSALAEAGVAAANADFTFVSSDPTKATVSAAGLVTAVAVGTTTITATEKNGTKSVSVGVTVVA